MLTKFHKNINAPYSNIMGGSFCSNYKSTYTHRATKRVIPLRHRRDTNAEGTTLKIWLVYILHIIWGLDQTL